MTNPTHAVAAVTPICGREIEAFHRGTDSAGPTGGRADGPTTVFEVTCERVGPPPRAVRAPGTSFRVTARRRDPSGPGAAVVTHEADSLWSALTAVRADLEREGWLLPIAAARRDSHALYADRHLDLPVVHRFADPTVTEGVLADAPQTEIGTVADQQQAYHQWLAATAGPGARP